MYDIACMSSERTLDTIRDAALRTATGAFRTSPTSSIIADVNESPLALRRCVLIMRYACKLRQFLDHQTYEYVFSGRQLAVFETSERLRAVSFCLRVPKLLLEAIVRLRGFASVSIFRIPPWELSVPVSLAATL